MAQATKKLDSLNQKKELLLGEVTNKQQALLGNTKNKLTDWQTKVQSKLDPDGMGSDLGLPSAQMPNLPNESFDLPSTDLNIPPLGDADFRGLGLSEELSELNQTLSFGEMEGLTNLQDQFGDIKQQVPSLEAIQTNPDQLIEVATKNIEGVADIRQELGAAGLENSELGKLATAAQDPQAMKQVVAEQVKQEAFNHFAGKEQVLQAAMEQISKYKQMYSSVGSLSEIKNLKRPPNPMKGKPLIERIVPGIAIQIQTKNYLNFDFNPYATYLLTGRMAIGAGWNERLAVDWAAKKTMSEGRVYGPRIFFEYKLPSGFVLRQEFEEMNSLVPSLSTGHPERKREYSVP